MAASRRSGPEPPLPMANMLCTPADLARSSISARSASKSSDSRCACESIISKFGAAPFLLFSFYLVLLRSSSKDVSHLRRSELSSQFLPALPGWASLCRAYGAGAIAHFCVRHPSLYLRACGDVFGESAEDWFAVGAYGCG